MLPWLYPLFAALTGACVGSFLNVCIYRIPKNESVVSLPRLRLRAAHRVYDNIPC